MSVVVEFDPEVPATYVRLRDDAVARTVEVMDAYCVVDLGAAGEPLGVEILGSPADISERVFQALATTLSSLDIDIVRIAPSGHTVAAA